MAHDLHYHALRHSPVDHVPACGPAQVVPNHSRTTSYPTRLLPALAKRSDALSNVSASQVRKEPRHDSTRPPLQVFHSRQLLGDALYELRGQVRYPSITILGYPRLKP
jgi:hypothetical protein